MLVFVDVEGWWWWWLSTLRMYIKKEKMKMKTICLHGWVVVVNASEPRGYAEHADRHAWCYNTARNTHRKASVQAWNRQTHLLGAQGCAEMKQVGLGAAQTRRWHTYMCTAFPRSREDLKKRQKSWIHLPGERDRAYANQTGSRATRTRSVSACTRAERCGKLN